MVGLEERVTGPAAPCNLQCLRKINMIHVCNTDAIASEILVYGFSSQSTVSRPLTAASMHTTVTFISEPIDCDWRGRVYLCDVSRMRGSNNFAATMCNHAVMK